MDNRRTQTINRQSSSAAFVSDDSTQERLNLILAANAEIAREKEMFADFREQTEASLIRHPLKTGKIFSIFGLLLGLFPPAAIFYRMISNSNNAEPAIIFLFIFVNLTCAVAGYFSGNLIGRMISKAEKYSWSRMILLLPLIGVLWGLIVGGIGGLFIFIIGAFVGAVIAAMVGSVGVTSLAIFHRLLKRGDVMERNQFLPLAFGIVLTISAFILSM
jgi:hypothetical protein